MLKLFNWIKKIIIYREYKYRIYTKLNLKEIIKDKSTDDFDIDAPCVDSPCRLLVVLKRAYCLI